MHGLQQLISDPTHQLPSSLSCIDLIFTDQTNLVVDHYQIIYCKFNLMTEHPPENERLVYKCSNQNTIAKALD